MQTISDTLVCIICGEPATRAFGSSGALPLCPLYSCEQLLSDDINFELDLHDAASRLHASQKGAQA